MTKKHYLLYHQILCKIFSTFLYILIYMYFMNIYGRVF